VRALYEQVMLLPQPDVDALVGPLVARLAPLYRDGRLDRSSPDFWAARAAEQFGLPGGHVDRGILSIYLLNLVHLAPGEGTYFEAGLPHAYLEGIAVEIMANSDNVIRGGLTPKHVDVPELLRILSFEPATPHPLVGEPAGPAEHRYATPAAEFGLSRLDLGPATEAGCEASGPEALIVIDGTPQLRWRRGRLPLARGGAVLVPAGVSYTLTSPGPACLFRAFVPPASRG
jgi:mannose-6-phosphate isomerase